MIDCRAIMDRAFAKLGDLKEGKSVGSVVQGDVMFRGTHLYETRAEAVKAAENADMSENDRRIMSEAQSVIDEMSRDIVEQINRGFLS
jgi:hypothetical protein